MGNPSLRQSWCKVYLYYPKFFILSESLKFHWVSLLWQFSVIPTPTLLGGKQLGHAYAGKVPIKSPQSFGRLMGCQCIVSWLSLSKGSIKLYQPCCPHIYMNRGIEYKCNFDILLYFTYVFLLRQWLIEVFLHYLQLEVITENLHWTQFCLLIVFEDLFSGTIAHPFQAMMNLHGKRRDPTWNVKYKQTVPRQVFLIVGKLNESVSLGDTWKDANIYLVIIILRFLSLANIFIWEGRTSYA